MAFKPAQTGSLCYITETFLSKMVLSYDYVCFENTQIQTILNIEMVI